MSRASKAPGARLGTRRRTDLSSQQVVWAPEVPPGPLLFHEKGLEFAPQQIPGPQSQLGGLVGSRWKTRWKICLELGLNSGPQALSPGHNHYTTHPHIHTHAHTHARTHTRAHTHTRTHTHTLIHSLLLSFQLILQFLRLLLLTINKSLVLST